MSVIAKNGSGNAYASALFEARAILHLSPTYQVAATMLTHGEADANVAIATYQSQVAQLQSDFNVDLRSITGQPQQIPMLVSQQNAFPNIGGGVNNSAIAQWKASLAAPSTIVGVCPKYQYSFQGDRAHLTNASYILLGEKYAQALYSIIQTGSWQPLYPISFHRVSNAITVTFNVPVLPLVFDNSRSAPHQNGTKYGDNGSVFGAGTGWTAGKGFELFNGSTPIPIASCNISGSTVIITGTSQPDTVAYAHTPDNGTPGTYTGGFPDGRCGLLHDSDTFTGLSGTTQVNWSWEFSQGGL
jgi:hypothetical protein